jgi:hypothetical protein
MREWGTKTRPEEQQEGGRLQWRRKEINGYGDERKRHATVERLTTGLLNQIKFKTCLKKEKKKK